MTVSTPGTFSVLASCDDYVEPADYPAQTLTVNAPPPPPVSSTPPKTVPTTTVTTSSGPLSTSSQTCHPSITLVNYTGSVSQGGSLGVDLTCFQPGEKIQVFLHSDPVLLTTLISDDSGNASGTVTIPLDAAIGAHTITVVGEISGISLEAPIMVEAAVETTATAPLTQTSTSAAQPVEVVTTTTLANTGTNAAAMTIWGVVLLAVGGIVVALTRKRGGKHVGD